MIRSLLTVSTGTLASRLLGFARDAMVAALLGAGPVADAFLVAFQLVNVIRRLLTEGALNAALIPAWLRVRAVQGEIAAAAFAGRVLGTISVALMAVTVLIGFAMPLVIALLAPGFVGSDTLRLAVNDARLMLPYLAFAGPVTVMMGLLNAQQRFVLTAFSPLLFNIALITVMIALLAWRQEAANAALLIAATVGAAGLLQLSMLVLRRGPDNFATPLRVSFDTEMRGFLRKALPGMVANSGPQLLIVAGAIIASRAPSVVSWLYFANRLIELPLGIVGTAMGTVLVPELTRAVRSDDHAAIGHAESRGLELAVGLALPATLGLMVLSQPIVQMLFEHGAFDATDTAATAQALRWLALGLPAHVLVKALSPAFFARDDTMTPLWATLTGLAIAIVAALALGRFGAAGIAASIAVAAWSSAAVLIARSAASFGFALDAGARRRLPRILAAALAMGALLWLVAGLAWPWAAAPGLGQAALLGGLIAGGLAAYAALLAVSGVVTPTDALRAVRQSRIGDLRG